MESRKYPRTYHFPFSPGTTSDDRIASDWAAVLQHELVMTEKLDGENTCLKAEGVFARSHAAPTLNPWAVKMRELWELHRHALNDLEVFGENLYAIHSIEYERLENYLFRHPTRRRVAGLGRGGVLRYPTRPAHRSGLGPGHFFKTRNRGKNRTGNGRREPPWRCLRGLRFPQRRALSCGRF